VLDRDTVMTYAELEDLCGGELPASRRYPAFWSNSSVYAKHWLAAGYIVSRAGCRPDEVRFIRKTVTPSTDAADPRRTSGRTPARPLACTPADIILVGCVKTKRTVPSAARDLYASPLFARRRAFAEAVSYTHLTLPTLYSV